LRKANEGNSEDLKKPFQTLDFLVRDWANFDEDWDMAQCRKQMAEHLARHVDPDTVVENSTAKAMQNMFEKIGCFCMPHPGLQISNKKWTGNVKDISPDFVRFIDEYVREVFTTDLDVKTLLGQELSTLTLPHVLRDFVKCFQDSTPVAMSFVEAMTNATVLMAKEKFLKKYTNRLDDALAKNKQGLEPKEFAELHRSTSFEIEKEFKTATILGSDEKRNDTWEEIQKQVKELHQRYEVENARRLEQALIVFANLAILGLALFVLDRISDWACDWWLQTCKDLSSLMVLAYLPIFAYIGFFVWKLTKERGKMQAAAAGAELWKEMVRLMTVYGELFKKLQMSDVQEFVQRAIAAAKALFASVSKGESKKNK